MQESESGQNILIELEVMRLFAEEDNLSYKEISELFTEYNVWKLFEDCYEGNHLLSMEENYEDTRRYLINEGAKL
jgi:hypothetical protein